MWQSVGYSGPLLTEALLSRLAVTPAATTMAVSWPSTPLVYTTTLPQVSSHPYERIFSSPDPFLSCTARIDLSYDAELIEEGAQSFLCPSLVKPSLQPQGSSTMAVCEKQTPVVPPVCLPSVTNYRVAGFSFQHPGVLYVWSSIYGCSQPSSSLAWVDGTSLGVV